MPLDDPRRQSIQQWVDAALSGTVDLAYVLGPTELRSDMETLAEGRLFSVAEITGAAQGIDLKDPLADAALWPLGIVPGTSYQVPSYVTIGSGTDPAATVRVNAAEFLILVAKAFLALQQGRSSEMVKADPARPLSEWAHRIQTLDGGYNPSSVNVYKGPKGEFSFNHIQLWTFKPAQFRN